MFHLPQICRLFLILFLILIQWETSKKLHGNIMDVALNIGLVTNDPKVVPPCIMCVQYCGGGGGGGRNFEYGAGIS